MEALAVVGLLCGAFAGARAWSYAPAIPGVLRCRICVVPLLLVVLCPAGFWASSIWASGSRGVCYPRQTQLRVSVYVARIASMGGKYEQAVECVCLRRDVLLVVTVGLHIAAVRRVATLRSARRVTFDRGFWCR